jgi:hypothetical protein
MEEEEIMGTKRYLGDGVYVNFDDRRLELTTEDGITTTNTIVLEAEVYAELLKYVKEVVNA